MWKFNDSWKKSIFQFLLSTHISVKYHITQNPDKQKVDTLFWRERVDLPKTLFTSKKIIWFSKDLQFSIDHMLKIAHIYKAWIFLKVTKYSGLNFFLYIGKYFSFNLYQDLKKKVVDVFRKKYFCVFFLYLHGITRRKIQKKSFWKILT